MIKRVTKFEIDGKLFDSESDARHHENWTIACRNIMSVLTESIKTGRVDAVIGQMVEEAAAVQNILATYRKRLPKNYPMKEVA